MNLTLESNSATDTDDDGVPDFIEDANQDGIVQIGRASCRERV